MTFFKLAVNSIEVERRLIALLNGNGFTTKPASVLGMGSFEVHVEVIPVEAPVERVAA